MSLGNSAKIIGGNTSIYKSKPGLSLDIDTIAYITANGITDNNEKIIANNFIVGLKNANLFDTNIFEVINPCLGYLGLSPSQARYAKTISVINPNNVRKLTYNGVPNTTKEGINWSGANANTGIQLNQVVPTNWSLFCVNSGMNDSFLGIISTQSNFGYISGWAANGVSYIVDYNYSAYGQYFGFLVTNKMIGAIVENGNAYSSIEATKSSLLFTETATNWGIYANQYWWLDFYNTKPGGLQTKFYAIAKVGLTQTQLTDFNTLVNNLITQKAAL